MWHPPSNGVFNVNFDGSSSFGNLSRAGFGGLICDPHGEWCTGFSRFCGVTSNIVAWNAGFRYIIIEFDSQSAMTMIPKQHLNISIRMLPTSHISVAYNCSSVVCSVVFHHTLSEGNEVAYWLAKFGASSEDYVKTSTSCPPTFFVLYLLMP
jgi:hypothetical protein